MPKLHPLLLLFAGLLFCGCASTGESESLAPEAYVPLDQSNQGPRSIGKLMTDLDKTIKAWVEKTWNASEEREKVKQGSLELLIQQQVDKRKDEILSELESGPVQNRIVAAAALGFSRDRAMLSPLLNALGDSNERVVTNALLGLGVLQSPDTPLGEISRILRFDPISQHRWGAANCLRSVLETGVTPSGDEVEEAARAGLSDAEPMVRSQCCLILAHLGQAESVNLLVPLLYDDIPLVHSAAIRAVAHLGKLHGEVRSEAAHRLIDVMEDADARQKRRVARSLIEMSGHNYELSIELWREWADRLQ